MYAVSIYVYVFNNYIARYRSMEDICELRPRYPHSGTYLKLF